MTPDSIVDAANVHMDIAGKIRRYLGEISARRRLPNGLGRSVRELRDQLRITRKELGRKAGYADKTVRNLENGDSVRLATATAILEALSRSYITLLPKASLPFWLKVADEQWDGRWFGPASLLKAEYEIVRFHGINSESRVQELLGWCEGPAVAGVRILRGPGGVGKTRLALELCRRLRKQIVPWCAGFVDPSNLPVAPNPWIDFSASSERVLVVVDYAGDRAKTEVIGRLIAGLIQSPCAQARLLLLDRDDLWLGRLYENAQARRVLSGTMLNLSRFSLAIRPVAVSLHERRESWRLASANFAEKLGKSLPVCGCPDLEAPCFKSILILHMQALLHVLGVDHSASERDILWELIEREREHWRRLMHTHNIPDLLFPAVEEAMYWIGQNDGVEGRERAVDLLCRIPLLDGQPKAVVAAIVSTLRECYPQGVDGIAGLQPDRLHEYFASEYIANRIRRTQPSRKPNRS